MYSTQENPSSRPIRFLSAWKSALRRFAELRGDYVSVVQRH